MTAAVFVISSRRNRGLRHPVSYCFVGFALQGAEDQTDAIDGCPKTIATGDRR